MHHIGLYDSVKTECLGKIWLSSYLQEKLSANQIAKFLNIYCLKNYRRYKVAFLHAGAYLVKPQVYQVILEGVVRNAQTCPKKLQKFENLLFF